jgi:SLAP domain-containing protein
MEVYTLANLGNNIETKLSLPENLDNIVSDVQKEILNDEVAQLSPIKENDINISTVYVFENKDNIEAKVYFRNGLSRKINFEYLPLIMVNSKDEIIAKKTFNLKEMGDFPPDSARPWKLFFDKSEVNMNKFSPEDCKVIFDTGLKAVKYAPITLDEDSVGEKKYVSMFQDFMKTLPGVKRDNISISKFKIALQEQGKIIVTLIVRNGCNKSINIEKLPITIKDEKGTIVASGIFETNGLKVEPMKARVCNFTFNTNVNMELEHSVVLDNWNVVFSQS